MFTLVLIIYGTYSLQQLPIDAVPDITNNQVQIITVSSTLATQEVEQFVTAPIEQSIASLPDLEEMRSISRFGLSVVTVVFKDKVDIYFARQLVDQRLKDAEEKIPAGVGKPEMAPVSTGLGEIFQYVISADSAYKDKYSAADLRTFQDWIVARQLIGTPGVAEVNSFGGKLKQYEVAVDPVRLKSMNVSIPEIFDALKNNNENTGGAYIEKKPNAYFIRGVGLVRSLEDIGKIVVKMNANGTPILIRDVATPQFGHAIRYGAMTRNGEGEVVGGIVMMLKGANSAEVVEKVKEKLPNIQKALPKGITIEPFLDRTNLVKRAVGTVEKNLLEGALIVIFILVLFLGNFRAGLIVASVIPLSMLFAIIMMNVFGITGNLMSLGAIDFGLIVDGAVIIVEAILHRVSNLKTELADHPNLHSQKFSEKPSLTNQQMDKEVYHSASRMMNFATFGQIIILIVYIPILTLVGIEGKMFGPMAKVVSFAIVGALILSLTYVPMMSALFLPRKTSHTKNFSDRMMNFFQRMYTPIIEYAIRKRILVVIIATGLFAGAALMFTRMGGEFIPTLEEGDFAFHSILPEGASLSQSIDNNNEVEKIIKRFPEVKEIISKSGAAEIPTDPMPPNATDLMIILKEKDDWTTAHNREDLQDTMMKALSVIPGVFFEATQPIQMRFNELMTGVRQDVAVKIFGENIDSLAFYAQQVSNIIQSVEGATEPQAERTTGLPQITIEYDRSRVAQYGLQISELNRIVRTAFAGEATGSVYENERRFEMVVRLANQNRTEIDDVRNLYVPLPNGGQIPLQQVATIEYVIGPSQISREEAKRRIVIGFNVRGRDVKSVVSDLQNKLSSLKLPPGYYITYGGTFKNLEEASARLMIAVPVALLLIFVLLFFTFGSTREALLIYTAIPMSAIGGVLALWLRDMPFSISAGVGFIALFGVAVLNGIVLISTFNELEKDGVTDILERVRKGTRIRLRPVLMTAAVASFGFLPMAISTSAGAEVQKPLATVVIGGLVSATALTLIVLPALYLLFTSNKKRKSNSKLTATIVAAVALFPSNIMHAQEKHLSIEACVDTALKYNPSFQASQLEVTRNKKLQKTAIDLNRTEIFYENEDLIKDNAAEDGILKIGLSQSIEFPTRFITQKKFNKQNTRFAETSLTLVQRQLVQQVRSAYFYLWLAIEQQNLLKQQDSIYTDFEAAATLRFSSGETGKLEQISAQAKHKEIQLALQNANSNVVMAQQEMRKLLNTGDTILPIAEKMIKLPAVINPEPTGNVNHPFLQLSQQRISLSHYQKKLESGKLLPDISVRYFNQNWYNETPGYYGYSIGIGIPLFFWSQQGKIQAAKLQQQISEKNYISDSLQFSTGYKRAYQEYQKNSSLVNYYETIGMQQADEILNAATIAYRNGEISHIEFTALITQSIDIKNNYLNALNNFNQSVIQISFYYNN